MGGVVYLQQPKRARQTKSSARFLVLTAPLPPRTTAANDSDSAAAQFWTDLESDKTRKAALVEHKRFEVVYDRGAETVLQKVDQQKRQQGAREKGSGGGGSPTPSSESHMSADEHPRELSSSDSEAEAEGLPLTNSAGKSKRSALGPHQTKSRTTASSSPGLLLVLVALVLATTAYYLLSSVGASPSAVHEHVLAKFEHVRNHGWSSACNWRKWTGSSNSNWGLGQWGNKDTLYNRLFK